jgi:MFS family permease
VSHPRDRRSPRIIRGLRRGGADAIDRVRHRLAEPDPERRALDRLAWVHATSGFGDALVAVALAGTLFFSVPVAAARPRVALYLLITVAPFAVVAPLLGRLLDGRSGASRVAMIVALVVRAVLAWVAAPRLNGLLLFPLAFGLLVFSRVHGISRSALVPELVGPGRDLVPINSRMARVIAIGGTVGGLLGVAVQKLLGGGGVLRLAAAVFLVGGFLATSVPALHDAWHRTGPRGPGEAPTQPEGPARPAQGATARPGRVGRWPVARIRLARAASAATRAAGGFVLFLLAFALRRRGVSTAGLGLLVAGIGAGGLIGAFLVPRLARRLREEGLLAFGLGLSAVTSLLLAGRVGVATAGIAGLIAGTAASAARLGFESLVQRDVPSAIRGTTITRSETVFQLAWVFGAVIPVALPVPANQGLLAVGSACLLAVGVYLFGLMRLRNGPRPRAAPSPAPRPEAHGR